MNFILCPSVGWPVLFTATQPQPRFRRDIPIGVAALLRILIGTFCIAPILSRGANSDVTVAVYSSVSPAYVRTPLPGGSFKAETYAFGEGGDLGGVKKDLSAEQLHFADVVRRIAPSLKAQNYIPAKNSDPQHTDLLIMVYWGTTVGTDGTANSAEYQIAQSLIPAAMPPPPPPPNGTGGSAMVSDPSSSGAAQMAQEASIIRGANDSALQQSLSMTSMANRVRDHQNLQNATILGYLPEVQRVSEGSLAFNSRRQDVIDEVEESRYYVVLLAYDFQTLLLHKERKMLWQTRFSIRERRNDFGDQLAAMAESAARFFGQNTDGLIRKSVPGTSVHLGELKVLGVEPEEKK